MTTREIVVHYGPEADTLTVGFYEERHRPHNQELVAGRFPLNPVMRDGFNVTPNDQREPLEIEEWWGRPFIEVETVDDYEQFVRENQARLLRDRPELARPDVDAYVIEEREKWLKQCPSGTSYTVRCLDGGAWDRSTWWGDAETLEGAIEICEKGPRRNRK